MSDDAPTVTAETIPPPPAKGAAALVMMGERGLMLRSLDDLLRFARMAVEGGAAPRGMSAGAAAMAIQAGLERGLGVLGGLQQCVVINGVLSWRGQGAVALIQNSPACKPGSLRFWTEGEGEGMTGVAVAWRTGYAQPERREFAVKDARLAGLWGKEGPWKQYPKRQLAWRAVGFLARDVFPDILGGFPLAEEVQDFELVTPTAPGPGRVRELPPPTSPDPLFSSLGIGPVEMAAHSEKAIPLEDVPAEPVPPFESHAEADRAIAEQEGQAELFGKR